MKVQSRVARTAPKVSRDDEEVNACELLVTELQLRRERLRELLRMVVIEAQQRSRARRPNIARPKCSRAAAA